MHFFVSAREWERERAGVEPHLEFHTYRTSVGTWTHLEIKSKEIMSSFYPVFWSLCSCWPSLLGSATLEIKAVSTSFWCEVNSLPEREQPVTGKLLSKWRLKWKTYLRSANVLQEPQGLIAEGRSWTCPWLQFNVPSHSLKSKTKQKTP